MAATAGKSGMLCTLLVEGAAVGESQNFSLHLGQALIDLTNRDSAYWRQIISSVRDWSISGDGLYITANVGKKVLVDHWENRTPATITVLLTLADGVITASGEAILESLDFPAPHDGPATITFSLQGTEALSLSIS